MRVRAAAIVVLTAAAALVAASTAGAQNRAGNCACSDPKAGKFL